MVIYFLQLNSLLPVLHNKKITIEKQKQYESEIYQSDGAETDSKLINYDILRSHSNDYILHKDYNK